jgi:FkbM family methyltransferase
MDLMQLSPLMRPAANGLIVLNIAGLVLFYLYPPSGAVVLSLAGRGPECRISDVFRASLRRHKQLDLEHRNVQTTREVERNSVFQLLETSHGRFWEPVPRGSGSAVVPQLGELEAKYSDFPLKSIGKGDIVLDCGANVGTFTRAALTWGAAVVVAVEPQPKNIECLRRNFAAEIAAGRVIVYPKGVWDKDDILTLMEHDDTNAMDSFVRPEHTHGGIQVPLTTIDKMVAELGLPRVDFIKMDIEGAEQRALAGARETMAKYRPRMEISVNHLPEDPRMVPVVIRRAKPDYHMLCQVCVIDTSAWGVVPEILYFY